MALEELAIALRTMMERGLWYIAGHVPARLRQDQIPSRASTRPAVSDRIEDALRQVFTAAGVGARIVRKTVGPRITLYEIRKDPAETVKRILQLQQELEYATGTSQVRIICPIPGKSAIGIEIPRDTFEPILLDSLADGFARREPHPLLTVVGRDIEGRSVIVNLAEMPHLLIAGTTGAGKSSCLNAMLVSLIRRAGPEHLRMVLIDPKMVEFILYEDVPHLLMPVVTDAGHALSAFGWLIEEMERRYRSFSALRVRNIDEYNIKVSEPIPYILVVVDELADLMMVVGTEAEECIVRLGQKARASGIHLVLATQRPSVKVITGLIKANLPSRLAFAVSSGVDSDVILDMRGAERLLGKGDGLFLPMGSRYPIRIQGPLVSDSDIQSAVQAAQLGTAVVDQVSLTESVIGDDPLLARAVKLVRDSGTGSVSALQRELSLGFVRANSLMESMEERGIVGPARTGKPREVLPQTDGGLVHES